MDVSADSDRPGDAFDDSDPLPALRVRGEDEPTPVRGESGAAACAGVPRVQLVCVGNDREESERTMTTNGNELVAATTTPKSAGLVPTTMSEAFNLAKAAAASRMFGMETPEQALMCLMRGMELGFAPAASLSAFHVIKGKPCLSADAQVALCKSRKDICKYFTLISSDENQATYETHRIGDPAPVRMSFTWQDAVDAGLTTLPGDMWRKYRKTMLRRRGASQLAKDVYPELLLGVYDPEEMESSQAQDAAPHATITVVEEPRSSVEVAPLGEPDAGYDAFAKAMAMALETARPLTKNQAVSLWIDYADADAPAPRVRAENGERVMKEINAATRTEPNDPRTAVFQSVAAFRNAVTHAKHREEHDSYAALVLDVDECKQPEEIAVAWMEHADALAALPAEAHAFALMYCGSRVSGCEGGPKQGQAWLKKRIAELGGTPPEKPTRRDGKNATGDHGAADSSVAAAEAMPASPEIAAAVARESVAVVEEMLREQWDAGMVTPEHWRAHIATHAVEYAITASHCKHAHRFGRAAEASVYRGVTIGRLREIGLSDSAASTALDSALKAKAAKAAEKAAA